MPLPRFRRPEPRPLARAAVEFLNAANGFRPLARKGYSTVLVFWFGWPTSEVPGLYFAASLLDALRRGRRGDFAGRRGKAALALTAASWAILGVIRYRGVTTPGPILEAGLRDQLGPDYAEALADLPQHAADATRTAQPAAGHHRGPPPVCREDERGVLRSARPGQPGRHLAAPRPAARRQGAGAGAGARRRVDDRDAPPAGLSADEPPRRARLGLRVAGLPGVPGAHLARSHRRRQAGAGLGQGKHRRLRRRPEFRCDHRRVGRRPPVRAGRPDPERPQIPAGLRRRRHLGGCRGSGLRPLRLVLHRGRGPPRVRRATREVGRASRNSAPTATSTSTPRRSARCGPTRRRSSCCTATTTP